MLRKRILSALLAVLFVLSLTGCKKEIPIDNTTVVTDKETKENSDKEGSLQNTQLEEQNLVPEEGAKLTYWTGDVEFGEAVGKKFEEKYGVPVTVEEVGLGAIDKIALSGPAGTGADVFMSPHDSFQHGVASGLFLELEEPVVTNIKERVNEVGVETVTAEGKVYGVPISLETTCLFYNKDIVGEKPAAALEEIMEKAKEFNDSAKNEFYFLATIGDGYKIYPMLSSYGFSLFGEGGKDENNPGFDTDEFEKGLELVSSLHEIMPINAIDLGNVSFLKSRFMEGKVAYEISGPWDIAEFKKSGVNFGVTVLPTFKGRVLTPFAGVQNAHVSAFTDYPIAAQLFAEYLVSDEAASLLYEVANKIPTLKDISNIRGLSEDEYIKPFVEQFANSFPMPSAQRISYYWTISASVCQAVFDGQLTPEEGRQKAVSDWNTMLTTE
ncbi:maltose ABC transporter substrate-binding protein [Anaerocolumna aminovalerica]|uniref:sugar ABC transporter substrate-binding protein n=1 Tax=Anaerocolumna aminovalerica TaxID=1527 RepID=UPI001C0E92EA|nr:maltose ABC transporter substrate-binding protein [Anaerocolumna aminovalerica]MBU5334495.1 maltose ABC transporter substrate-binding protein [Anaerocolumna aminovalerica]